MLNFEYNDFTKDLIDLLTNLAIPFDEIVPINYSVNKNYVVQGNTKYFCRIYRPFKETEQTILAEHDYLFFLRKQGVKCSVPLEFEGKTIHQVLSSHTILFVTFFEFIEGLSLTKTQWDHDFIFDWGRALGCLHRCSKIYTSPSYSRNHWYKMSLHSDIIVKHEKCHFLEKEHEYILREFSGWPIDQSTYGLVHYDLHQGNILKTNSDTYTIDFDDLCYHWYIWDFAIIWHRLSSGFMMQDQQHLKEIFLQGYRTQTELTQFFEEKLNFMERTRHFYMLNWLAYRKDEYKWSQIAEKYLQRYMLYLEEKHSL